MSRDSMSAEVLTALRAAAQTVEEDADRVAGDVAVRLHAETPELLDDPGSIAETRRASRATILSFLEALRHGTSPQVSEPAAAALTPARVLARAGLGIRPLLRFCRVGHAEFLAAWEEALAAQNLPQRVLADATQASQRLSFAWMDRFSERLSTEYESEVARFASNRQAQVAGVVESLLQDDPLDADAASRVLGYELGRWHVAVVVWALPAVGEDLSARLRVAAADVATHLGKGQPLVVPAGSSALRIWIGAAGAFSDEQLRAVGGRFRTDGVLLALGEPAHGAPGFRATWQDADDAFRLALAAGAAPGSVTLFREVELTALLSRDAERLRRFVQRQLGPLARDDEEFAKLRVTLALSLEDGATRQSVARRLGIHPNTVTNRVSACRELLPHVGDRPVEVQVALSVAAKVPTVLRRD